MFDVVLGFCLLLLNLNRFAEDNIIIKLISPIVLVFLFIRYYGKNAAYKSEDAKLSYQSKFLYFICSVVGIGLLRNNNPDATRLSIINSFFSYTAFIICTIQVYKYIRLRYNGSIVMYHRVIIGPFFLLATLNVIFWILGLKALGSDPDIGPAVMLSNLGFAVERVSFPFANGINSYATVIGGLFCIELVYFFVLKNRNIYALARFFIFLVTLLLTDSRSALIYPILVLGFIYLMKGWKRINFIKYINWIIILGPIIFISFLPLLAQLDYFAQLSRSSTDFATGNARFIIWGIAFAQFAEFKPIHLIGYGIFGHVASGASRLWAGFFGYMDQPEAVHPHNMMLSIIFDYGYLGLFSLIAFIYMATKRLTLIWYSNKLMVIFFCSFLFYFLIISITESFFGFYYLNSIYLIILFLLIPYNLKVEKTNLNIVQ